MALGGRGGRTVAVGPHGSVTPETTLREARHRRRGARRMPRRSSRHAGRTPPISARVPALAFREGDVGPRHRRPGMPDALHRSSAPLRWDQDEWVDAPPPPSPPLRPRGAPGPGAEVEASRGCPYHCSFCAKIDFRDKYRKRDLAPLLAEIDGLDRAGHRHTSTSSTRYSCPTAPAAGGPDSVACRSQFGIQTRIDLWTPDMLDLLGAAGCVSIEAGVESLTVGGPGRSSTSSCRMSTDDLAERLAACAPQACPSSRPTCIETATDDPVLVAAWRDDLRAAGRLGQRPGAALPLSESSPDYRKALGPARRRAPGSGRTPIISTSSTAFSDIQDEQPLPLHDLEAACCR